MTFDKTRKGSDIRLVPLGMETYLGPVGKEMAGQIAGKDMMHAGDRVTDRHRMEGVAMIT